MTAQRWSGDLKVRIKIREDANYSYDVTVIMGKKHPRESTQIYRTNVGASFVERTRRSEDSPELLDQIARSAITFSDEVGMMEHCAMEPCHDGCERIHVGRQEKYRWVGPPLTKKEVRQLKPGDEVYWNDPDHGVCSRYYKIAAIEMSGDMVLISGTDGSYLECFYKELS